MNEEVQTPDDENDEGIQQINQLDLLKSQARLMGITFSNNIGVDALKEKIEAKKQLIQYQSETLSKAGNTSNDVVADDVQSTNISLREWKRRDSMKLIRLRITNLDPKKKSWPGEILTVGNKYIGTVRKYIPFGEVGELGYHVPNCLYKMMRDKQFLQITRKKDSNGRERVEGKYVREYALEVLPPLTREELNRLKTAQLAQRMLEE